MSVLFATKRAMALATVGLCALTADLAGQQTTAAVEPAAAVLDYIRGADEHDAPRVSSALHDEVFHATILPGNELSVVDKATYVGAIRDKQIGGMARTIELGETTMLGDGLASVGVVAENSALRFDYLFTLVQRDGAWSIISSVSVVNRL